MNLREVQCLLKSKRVKSSFRILGKRFYYDVSVDIMLSTDDLFLVVSRDSY